MKELQDINKMEQDLRKQFSELDLSVLKKQVERKNRNIFNIYENIVRLHCFGDGIDKLLLLIFLQKGKKEFLSLYNYWKDSYLEKTMPDLKPIYRVWNKKENKFEYIDSFKEAFKRLEDRNLIFMLRIDSDFPEPIFEEDILFDKANNRFGILQSDLSNNNKINIICNNEKIDFKDFPFNKKIGNTFENSNLLNYN